MSVPPRAEPPVEPSGPLPLVTLTPGTSLFRIHSRHHGAIHYNPTADYRFNAPAGEFGVCYMAERFEGAFVETFCRGVAGHAPEVSRIEIDKRALSELKSDAPLTLVDLTGNGLAKLGLDGRIFTHEDYAWCQRWSRSWWRQHPPVHGLLYPSRHDPTERCVALFEGRSTLVATPVALSLSDPPFAPALNAAYERYQVALL